MTTKLFRAVLAVLTWLAAGCTGVPSGLRPVSPFDIQRYLGRWYEIARLDHSFERGLTDVSAEYRLLPGGAVAVLNRGFDPAAGKWREAQGTARFREAPDVGSLKVTFFWPFYGGYHVIALDPDYGWAVVAGPTRSYLWILARAPSLPEPLLRDLAAKARAMGFAADELIYVEHGRASSR